MEDFVTYELAVKLKEKGYPQHICDYAYITEDDCEENKYVVGDREYIPFIPDYLPTIAAPIISQVLKWLREENIILSINPSYFKGDCCFGWDCDIWINANYNHRCVSDNSYEQAALAGIEYVIDSLI